MDLSPGQVLHGGQYVIERLLGRGGFGTTYLARNRHAFDMYVVIKILNENLKYSPYFTKLEERFIREASLLFEFTHLHIVRIFSFFKEEGLFYIVMEYIEGETLYDTVINRGVLYEPEALHYIKQIGDALVTIHNQSVLHRDVKPHNIMLRSRSSDAVLIDFGIAREFTSNEIETLTMVSTDWYGAIEQYQTKAPKGAYTDVYALAATLYFSLTGKNPLPAIDRILNHDQLIPPNKINPTISNRVNQAILKGMALNSEERPQSINEWLRLLDLTNEARIYAQSPRAYNTNLTSTVRVRLLKILAFGAALVIFYLGWLIISIAKQHQSYPMRINASPVNSDRNSEVSGSDSKKLPAGNPLRRGSGAR